LFKKGSRGFFFKGTNGRWQGVVSEEDLALYDAKLRAILSPACVQWVSRGRLKAGDPRLL
jgi:aryl sulfotransferase